MLIKTGIFNVCLILGSLAGVHALADVNIPDDRHLGFSGIEYHAPRKARMVLYRYKAQKNRSLSEVGAFEAQSRDVLEMSDGRRRIIGVDSDIAADCSISIGNNNSTKPDIFSPREQVVVIEGDVVNLGNCQN